MSNKLLVAFNNGLEKFAFEQGVEHPEDWGALRHTAAGLFKVAATEEVTSQQLGGLGGAGLGALLAWAMNNENDSTAQRILRLLAGAGIGGAAGYGLGGVYSDEMAGIGEPSPAVQPPPPTLPEDEPVDIDTGLSNPIATLNRELNLKNASSGFEDGFDRWCRENDVNPDLLKQAVAKFAADSGDKSEAMKKLPEWLQNVDPEHNPVAARVRERMLRNKKDWAANVSGGRLNRGNIRTGR